MFYPFIPTIKVEVDFYFHYNGVKDFIFELLPKITLESNDVVIDNISCRVFALSFGLAFFDIVLSFNYAKNDLRGI